MIINEASPTQASRTLYLWFFTISCGYNWVHPTDKKGKCDNWDWNTHYPLQKERDMQSWIVHMLIYVMPHFVQSFKPNTLLENERSIMKMTHEEQNIERQYVSNRGNWKEWVLRWTAWYEARQADNSTYATAIPTIDSLPNKHHFIDVDTKQNTVTFPKPMQWTPLIVKDVQYPYVTYNWDSVKSAIFSASDESVILANVDSIFPDVETRNAEINGLITQNLSDENKAAVEFWLSTIPLPCKVVMLWKEHMKHETNMDVLFLSGLELSVGMFEISRLAWKSKKSHMQSRPIQDVRRLYKDNSWVSYYDTTPAYPDFPSEASAFSKLFASVMSARFGPNVPFLNTNSFRTFSLRKGESCIQPNISTDLSISWQMMADNCGMATQYAGIHTHSSHKAGQILADEVYSRVHEKWFS
jgi:hypothetical protein